MNWWKGLKGKIKFSEPLKRYTSFKIGGPAKFFTEPKDIRDLKSLLNLAKQYKIPPWVIGGGSNILINDKGVDGVVLRLNSPYFQKIHFNNNSLELKSGVRLKQLVYLSQKHGLSGAEFLAGIPGTVGGALAMNAGIPQQNIGDLVENVTIMDYNGKIKVLDKKKIRFGYRTSSLSKYIVLSARLKLKKKNKEGIREKIKEHLNYRKLSQDLSFPSAGCIFKNPARDSAGRLIDLCSLKGKRIGDACVSKRHANFILNLKCARAKDVLLLMKLIRQKVKKKFKITLEPEIKIWQ